MEGQGSCNIGDTKGETPAEEMKENFSFTSTDQHNPFGAVGPSERSRAKPSVWWHYSISGRQLGGPLGSSNPVRISNSPLSTSPYRLSTAISVTSGTYSTLLRGPHRRYLQLPTRGTRNAPPNHKHRQPMGKGGNENPRWGGPFCLRKLSPNQVTVLLLLRRTARRGQ